jgi:hypothetical protein
LRKTNLVRKEVSDVKQTRGAPPVALCVITAGILALHLAAILYVRHQIPRIEARIRTEASPGILAGNFEDDRLPLRNRPSGKLSGDVGMLAALREINGELPKHLWLTGSFFLGSLLWLRAPRTK